ncbi:Hypothetical protein NTJ_11291 [Nesidiocoris tenuis]|uniref:Reverse transcriptase domain-containing protein n=1 Tax=Nesidiocoris tenuis TaxID=355587 RepID=A0ABN7B6T3_9HEMI|nr:Hypothetical protein NTJ_11291 [Nesidiocoris tenuis]
MVDEPTEWVSNLVIAEIPNGSLRVCLDPKFLNEAIEGERTYIPTRDDIKTALQGKKIFTVMDMKDGFYHSELDEESSKLCTFSSPFGHYRFLSVPFGISSAPEVFQKCSTSAFDGIEGVVVYFDDVIVAAESEEKHDKLLKEVMEKAKQFGVKFNKSKMQFKQKSVKYVGLIFSSEGVSADPKTKSAVINMPDQNVAEVQTILGMCSYLSEFVPHLADITTPLRRFIRKDAEWKWQIEHRMAIKKIKSILSNPPVLGIFDPKKDLTMYVDASSTRLGCVLIQEGRPIAYASKSLTDTETQYAQIEKEMMSIWFGCSRFHQYVDGARVTVFTDHKPLLAIFKKELCDVTSRLQRYKLGLLKYDIDLRFVPGKKNLLADPLSRLYIEDMEPLQSKVQLVHGVVIGPEHSLQVSQEKLDKLRSETISDPVLSRVIRHYKLGWPKLSQPEIDECPFLLRYYKLQDDIQTCDDIILFGNRVVIPSSMQNEILGILHAGHTGLKKLN